VSFNNLQLIEPLLKALHHEGYTTPTPIQEQAIPIILKGKDLLGCAQTGTGKTAAFALPLLQLMDANRQQSNSNTRRAIQTLVLTPTRELAIQIGEGFTAYGKHLHLRNTVVFGGVSQSTQVRQLQAGVDILVATPGRLLDLIQQGFVKLGDIKFLVLDEADRMLDMGFVRDVKRIISMLPTKRQTLFFSATMPNEISALANSILNQPVKVEVTPVSSTVDTIKQFIYFTEKENKLHLLKHVLADETIGTALVFTRTKHGADKLAKFLSRSGIKAEAIHGNKSQGARQTALRNFKNRSTRILVATDIAARGIDIDDLTHVVNYELPEVPETYVHRIGRTGRAGASGHAFSFCSFEEKPLLRDIQKLIVKDIQVVDEHPYAMSLQLSDMREPPRAAQMPRSAGSRPGGGGGGGKRGRGLFRPAPAR
jgi:ATP-dependent RNA helicase RhlE